LTPEQRADALAKAAEARKARSELLASIKSGKESIEKVLKHRTASRTTSSVPTDRRPPQSTI